jgi:hypothetical protein
MKWIWITLAVIYFLSPYDLIPGVSWISWIDDIVVLILLFRYLSRLKHAATAQPPPFGDQGFRGQQAHSAGEEATHETHRPSRTPYEILEVSPNAGPDEIKTAYRKLANQYHPDKVAHLGKEFQELAEQRFKEIQQAYQKLTSA